MSVLTENSAFALRNAALIARLPVMQCRPVMHLPIELPVRRLLECLRICSVARGIGIVWNSCKPHINYMQLAFSSRGLAQVMRAHLLHQQLCNTCKRMPLKNTMNTKHTMQGLTNFGCKCTPTQCCHCQYMFSHKTSPLPLYNSLHHLQPTSTQLAGNP